ncbi:guanine deaminase [Novosphingobium sp. MBES04]|uniref:guanine deaminase n=1 Tax=Novosphingobium sp. MBES04 TaxID=1206458 RepID=UPI00057F5111|nr:guanine deaminase [Novosphingobium sp. MBES04]GAM05169.1 guanine deaminase [Novosphingobium sp. MBES04]
MALRAFRGEFLSLTCDPRDAGADGERAIRYEADGLLVVEDGIVVARGHHADLSGRFAQVPTETLPGLVVPGFIDAHVHYPQMDSMAAHGEQLLDWLERHIFPAEMAFAERAHADALAQAFLTEMLRNGTTSALVFATVHEHSVDALFEAALARRMRVISGKVQMDEGPEGLRDSVASGRAGSEALLRRWRGRGRLGYALTPRFALTSSDAQLADAGAFLAEHPEVLLHTHLAENVHECAAVAARFPDAADYLDVYDRFGLVGPRSVFAHGIHLLDRACARLHESGAGIAVCPSSNLFLGSGHFDFGQADRFGVKLGLGSDVGAGTTFSLLHTAGLAYQAALAREDRLSPFRALYLATLGSAQLLGIADKVGALEVGQEADFVVLDPAATPLLARRTQDAPLAQRLFALQVLGDDRAVARTYVLGGCAWERTA